MKELLDQTRAGWRTERKLEDIRHRARVSGHLLIRDDARTGRLSLLCVHCGAGVTWRDGGFTGTLAAWQTRCFPVEAP